MTITKMENGNEVTLNLEGWLDTEATPELETALAELPETTSALTMNLEKLEYVSSSGLRQIVAAHKQMNGNLTLESVSAEILDVLKMTGFDKKLHIS